MNFLQARTNMVLQQIRPWHVADEHVLRVLNTVSREKFVPRDYSFLAYADTDLPLPQRQQMLSPKIVGRALQALQLQPTARVLEIGTGTGYVTACLSLLAQHVTSIEIYSDLLQQAEQILLHESYRHVTLEHSDGVFGWEAAAPYHAIMVTGSYPLGVPEVLCEQLHTQGGRLFAICGEGTSMQAMVIERNGQHYRTESLFETYIPALIHAPQPKRFCF